MIVILEPRISPDKREYQQILSALQNLQGVGIQPTSIEGPKETIHEFYLSGKTDKVSVESLEALPGVSKVIRTSKAYRILGRNTDTDPSIKFQYQGLSFSQDDFHIFPGLCAVDNPQNVELMMKALSEAHIPCTRMGAYKPRTDPYSFQGHGDKCLQYVFETAGKYGIKIIAMEVTHERHVDEIQEALTQCGAPVGVMVQIGTRNAQNFELLKAVGAQTTFPILYKRGFGITLDESLSATEYLACSGNSNIIFCLRGMKSIYSGPHRNMADFSHVAVIKRLTRMPVCVDPSHSVGCLQVGPDGISDIFHATAQGVVSGANMLLVDFHPFPPKALVDARQAISTDQLKWFLEDIQLSRETYLKRRELAKQFT